MWDRYVKRYLAGSLCFLASLGLYGQPLTENEVRKWAMDKSQEVLIDTLVKVILKLEELNSLYEEQKIDFEQSREKWAQQISEARREIEEGLKSCQKSAESFEITIRKQAETIRETERALQRWRSGALFFAGVAAVSATILFLQFR